MTLLVFRVGLIVGVSGIVKSQVEKVMENWDYVVVCRDERGV